MRDVQAVGARVERVLEVAGLPGIRVVAKHGDIVVPAFLEVRLAAEQDPVGALLVDGAGDAWAVRAAGYGVRLAGVVDKLRIVAGLLAHLGVSHLAIGRSDRHGDGDGVEAAIGGVVVLADLLEERNLAEVVQDSYCSLGT